MIVLARIPRNGNLIHEPLISDHQKDNHNIPDGQTEVVDVTPKQKPIKPLVITNFNRHTFK